MSTVPKLYPHVKIVASLLAAATPVIKADVGKTPAGATANGGYAVIWPRDAQLTGPSGDMYADASPEVQVTANSSTADGAGIIADRILTELLSASPAPPAGRAWLNPAHPIAFVSAGMTTRDDDVNPPVWYSPLIFQLPTTPA